MAPRGMKTLLRRSAPAKLVGSGRRRCFCALRQGQPTGARLRGLTKRLAAKVWSEGTLPREAIESAVPRGGWRGQGGGLRRGRAVDAQVSRVVNAGKVRPKAGQYSLTKLVFAALEEHGLEPVLAQRALCSTSVHVGTAADLICHEASTGMMHVVELKCGCSGNKMAAATGKSGRRLNMKKPLSAVPDCVLNRHLLQLACTREMLLREKDTMKRLMAIGVDARVGGCLLYVDDQDTELHTLTEYWETRAPRVLAALK